MHSNTEVVEASSEIPQKELPINKLEMALILSRKLRDNAITGREFVFLLSCYMDIRRWKVDKRRTTKVRVRPDYKIESTASETDLHDLVSEIEKGDSN